MHEVGHAVGMTDYCGADSIMNNGVSTCNGGRWTAVMNYLANDRKSISTVYRGF